MMVRVPRHRVYDPAGGKRRGRGYMNYKQKWNLALLYIRVRKVNILGDMLYEYTRLRRLPRKSGLT